MKSILSLIVSSLVAIGAVAAEKAAVKAEDFRCEKMMGTSLAEFKEKLVESCNLNLPFSSSMSRVLNEEAYFYCCQKK